VSWSSWTRAERVHLRLLSNVSFGFETAPEEGPSLVNY